MTKPALGLFSFSGALFMLATLVSACGGSSSSTPLGTADGGTGTDGATAPGVDSGPSADGGTTTAQACDDWAHARCTRFDACSNALYDEIHWGDEATCETNSSALCVTNLSATGTAASASTYEACANALKTEVCADLFGDNPPAACAPLAGSIANGAACINGSQCQSTFCAVGANATCGTCAAVPKAGDSCSVDADCGARGGITCAAGACVAWGQASASCDAKTPCGPGLSCVGLTKLKPGMCQTDGNVVGSACDPKHQSAPGCDASLELTCDASTGMCVLNTVAGAGQTCGEVGGGTAKCSASGFCVVASSDAGADDAGADAGAAPIVGTCLAAAGNGAACDTSVGPSCVPPAKCVTGSDASPAGTCELADPSTCK